MLLSVHRFGILLRHLRKFHKNCIGSAEVAGKIKLGNTGQVLDYGAFITAVINFIIMAFVLFMLMKGINTIMHIGKKKEEEVKKE